MLTVVAIFLIVTMIMMTIGTFFCQCFFGEKDFISWDMNLIGGLCCCNIFSQIYSLFSGVGKAAFACLAVIWILISGYFFYRKRHIYKKWVDLFGTVLNKQSIPAFIMVTIAVVLWTAIVPQHYDTYLYHAQAIHWIEDYGVVPGLGNLHFRLAYNSAYMPLQALFSFKWLLGRSLHAMNGFFTLFMLIYIMTSLGNKADKKPGLSDVLKCGTLLYVFYDSFHVSSPNTDTVALLLTFYIIIKWSEFCENDIKSADPYAYLCLLTVYAMTLKVSVGVFALLTVCPAVILIKEKKVRDIFKYIISGILIVIPYIVRNIITSGYMLYPYKMSGIKKLDWIMPEKILQGDMAEIIAWGRGTLNVSRNDEHIWQWIGTWFSSINILWKVLSVLTVISIVYLVTDPVSKRREGKNLSYVVLIFVCMSGFFFWMFSAPLPRYGTIYMISIPCLAFADIFKVFLSSDKVYKNKKIILNLIRYATATAYMILFFGYSAVFGVRFPNVIIQDDYDNKETYSVFLDDTEFAAPIQGDQTGYEPFPSIPYPGSVKGIELRGDGLKDGFRQKQIHE